MLTYRDNKADTACNLECLENKPPVHEFEGPVKVVLMDMPPQVYINKMCMTGFIGIAHLLIGATVMTVLYFTLAMRLPLFETLHIILCTFGYQLCIPMGILMTSNLSGPSAQMKSKDRRKQHMIIQMIGLTCASAGSVMAFIKNGEFALALTPHAIMGLVAGVFAILSAMNGPAIFCTRDGSTFGKYIKAFHMFFGVPTFLSSSVCFCLGLFFSVQFKDWLEVKDVLYMLIMFCVFYTVVIIITPLKKWAKPIPDLKY